MLYDGIVVIGLLVVRLDGCGIISVLLVILVIGGFGYLYSVIINLVGFIGDGIVLGLWVGVVVSDFEFI